ncbi:MAG: cobalamin biosynthesis protein [Kaiparowitsia implicata GSE-PSE-MK54-09C]|jgi:cobalt-precorrin 5A hydrolase/precorrin-3B C17-methyltransferase|nr:cobalamin biosynthesis protein [Kaiparowitsia implicata GSE-PSE-MK54-09C]
MTPLVLTDLPPLWVGLGCQRGVTAAAIAQAITQVFAAHALDEGAIAALATLQAKTLEPGLVKFCGDRPLPLWGFSPEELRQVRVPYPSDRVAQRVGCPSVAEAAALLAQQHAFALGIQPVVAGSEPLWVPKQIVPSALGAITVAVAGSVITEGDSCKMG